MVSSIIVVNNKENLDLVSKKIENLRCKLLDLTHRNPLISANLRESSNASIRVVDEMPHFLLQTITNSSMRVVALPSLEEIPQDESSREFHDAFSESILNDSIYLKAIHNIDQNNTSVDDIRAQAERNLKDRIREKLQMPPRQTKISLSIRQHALNHNINPNYDLPLEEEQHSDGRHTDKNIQTLLLPDAFERKLNALLQKDKAWKEEVGINVLYAAFGFIEWQEDQKQQKSYSPLILLPIELKSECTKAGYEFWVSAQDAIPEWNTTLSEKFLSDYGVELPEYKEGQNIEEYFIQIANQKTQNIAWQLKRWVMIGVFPSAKLAMYKDLDPKHEWKFLENPIITSLFSGADNCVSAISGLSDEYNIDDIEFVDSLPTILSDADSSQFSAIIDVYSGKNIALEGPPGTGKSQTIV